MSYTIAVPISSIEKVLNYGIESIEPTTNGVTVCFGVEEITSFYPGLPIVVDLAYQQANNAYSQANTATGVAEAAFFYANTIGGGSAIDNVARVNAQSAYDGANTYFADTQNSITLITNINNSQNTSISLLNNNVSYITGVDNFQNTRISLAYDRANTSVNTILGTTGTITTSNGRIVFQSTNGVTVVGSGTSLTINTPQALRTTDNPTFSSLTLTSALSIINGGTGATSAAAALTNLLPTGTSAGYVLTTGGPGTYFWSPVSGGGGGGATPGTTINSSRLTYVANGSGLAYTTPTYIPGASQLRVYFDGIREYNSAYTETSNTVVTFNSPPAAGVDILLEVDGYINNPYYANTIAFTTPFGTIPASANTIQLAIEEVEINKASLFGASFSGMVTTPTAPINTSNNQVATTQFVNQLANSGITFSHNISGTAQNITQYTLNQSVGTSNQVQFDSLGVGTGASGTSGEILAINNITAYYSDDRLKTKLGPIKDALAKLKTLNGFYYQANQTAQNLGYKVKEEVGLSAQEVQKVLPQVVVPAPIDNQYLTIYYEKLIPLLVEAIKELTEKVENLEKNKKT
jgi:hypothetical protein